MKTKLFIPILILTVLTSSCKFRNNGNETKATETEMETVTDSTLAFNPADLPEDPLFNIYTTEGNIVIRLFKETPLHRDNFVKLASQHYFDSVLFHRVIYNFMIQTGDPLTKDPANADMFGEGGPDYTIPAEFVPELKHKKGSVAAARMGDNVNPMKESSGSQFYIVHNADHCRHLDGGYTVFGETIDGFEVIDRIASLRTDERDRPIKEARIISVTPIL